jgi:excisionase family DNA binding protein
VTPQTIRAWINSGKLTRYQAGRALRVHRDELERLLAAAPAEEEVELEPELRALRVYRRSRLARNVLGASGPVGWALRASGWTSRPSRRLLHEDLDALRDDGVLDELADLRAAVGDVEELRRSAATSNTSASSRRHRRGREARR